MRLVIISGLSGSGKSAALHTLEDSGYFCIDNLPVELMPLVVERMVGNRNYRLAAIGVDVRSGTEGIERIPGLLRDLRGRGVDVELVFLQAEARILFKRFSETRRKHPLSHGGLHLAEAIEQEWQLLAAITTSSDLTVDTTSLTVHALRELIRDRVARRPAEALSILFQSFGFKHGVPLDTDYLFDVRCLPNPHWEPALRALSGRDQRVIDFLIGHHAVQAMLEDIIGFLERWIGSFSDGTRSYLTVSVGCTGGYHRSVFFAERLCEHFGRKRAHVAVRHRELTG